MNYLRILNTLPITKATADYTIDDSIKQTNEVREFLNSSIKLTREYIGPDADIRALGMEYRQGSSFQDPEEAILSGTIDTSRVVKLTSDRSKWSLGVTIPLEDTSGDPGEDDSAGIISETWSSTMTQYQYPLEKYLNSDEARGVALWETSDPYLKKDFLYEYNELSVTKVDMPGSTQKKYTLSVLGTYVEELSGISEKAANIAALKWTGYDTVSRFYPQFTLTTVYKRYHLAHTRRKDLGHIDGWPNHYLHTDNTVSYLKTGFDWTKNNDGTATLVESWIGAPIEDGGWNWNLYGDGPDDERQWDFYCPWKKEGVNPKPPNKYEKK